MSEIRVDNIVSTTEGGTVALAGIASEAIKLQTARTIALTGDVIGEVLFDGTTNVSIAATIIGNSLELGSDTTGNYVATIADAGSSDISVSGSGSETAAVTLGLTTTGVSAGSYGSASVVPIITVDSRGRITAAGTTTLQSNSATATKLETSRTISLTGDVVGSVSFDGSANVSIAATIQPDSVGLGTDTTGNYVSSITNGSYITGGDGGSEGASLTLAVDATSANTASKVVVRDASGDFSAGTITANLTGTATTATNLADGANITTGTIDDARLPDLITSNINVNSGVSTFATVKATSFEGAVTGTASSTTNIPNLTGDVTSVNTTTTLATVNNDVGTYGSSTSIPSITVNAKGLVTGVTTNSITVGDGTLTLATSGTGLSGSQTFSANQSGNATFTVTSNATSDNINSTIVARNGSGGFSAGIVTATEFSTGSGTLGISTNTISGPTTITIDPAAVGDNTGTVVIKGDLQIDGTTTTVNSTTITVDDKNITLASGAANDAAADGGGITIESGDGNKTWNWVDSTDSWTSSENINVLTGKTYKIAGTDVLTSSTLGSGVVNSSLTSVGTLGNLNVSGVTTSQNGFVGNLTGTATSTTNIPNLTGDVTSVNTSTTLATVNSNVGTYGSSTAIPSITVNAKGLVTGVTTNSITVGDGTLTLNVSGTGLSGSQTFSANQSGNATFTVTSNATSNNTNSTIVSRDASGNFSAGTITANLTGTATTASSVTVDSVGLGTHTYGDYVKDITGTANQITVTGGTGEGSTPTLSVPNQFTAPQDVTVTRDLQVNRNLNVNGNITIGGTSATLFTSELKIYDPDIVLGFRTDGSGNDTSNDNTANHGGIAIASTEGTPLISLYDVGIGETNPATYKKFMWFKSGTFSGLGTDAWLSNYAIGIGSTQVPNGVRLAAGSVQITQNDISVVRNINASGVVTATSFVGAVTGTASSTTNIPNLTGDVTSVNTSTTLATVNSNVGTYGSSTAIPSITVNAKGLVTGVTTNSITVGDGTLTLNVSGTGLSGSQTFSANQSGNATFTVTSNATSNNTNSTIVARDASGNFTAGTITATTFSGSGASLTGVPISTGVSGLGANVATFLATPSSVNLASAVTDETGSGSLVFATSPSLTTPTLGVASATSINKVTITAPATGSTLTIADGKTLTASNTLTFTGTDASSVAFGSGGTVAYTSNKLSAFSATTSSELAGVISDETGSGALVFAASPTLTGTVTAANINSSGIVTATQFSTGSGTLGISTNTISGPATITIDPAAVGDNTGTVVIKGDLQIDGTTTTINSTVVTVDDLNITLADGAANASAANGAGITIAGASATLTYASTGDKWVFNKDVDAPNFNSTSDANLKENIEIYSNALETLQNLEGVKFTWKETQKPSIGVIAQQIENFVPELVQTGETHKTVNYNGLIGILIEAVKEQQTQINTLKEEIKALKN